jgi:hypothetical protein
MGIIMTSTDQASSGTSASNRNALGAHAAAFGISLGLTSLFNALLVVIKETNRETIFAWMTAATGHHWVTQGIIDLVVFVALGFVLVRYGESWRSRPNAVIAIAFGGIVLGVLIIAGFFA